MIKEFRLTHAAAKNNALNIISQLPVDSEKPLRVVIDEDKHSKSQMKKVWAMMRDLSEQVIWGGKLRPETTWKNLIAYQALKNLADEEGKEFKAEFIPSLDQTTLLSDYVSIRNLNKKIFVEIVMVAQEFGDNNNVIWKNEAQEVINLANKYKEQIERAKAKREQLK